MNCSRVNCLIALISCYLLSYCSATKAGGTRDDFYHGSDIAPQVIYRFDDHRYLIMTGSYGSVGNDPTYCSGQIWYTDTQKNIFSRVGDSDKNQWVTDKKWHSTQWQITASGQIILPPEFKFTHSSNQYIVIPEVGIPKKDASGHSTYSIYTLHTSRDYGITWENVNLSTKQLINFIPNEVELTVVNNQAFISTKKGLFISPVPLKSFFWYYYDYSKNDNPSNLPKAPPVIKNYRGWNNMQCSSAASLTKEEDDRFSNDKKRIWDSVK